MSVLMVQYEDVVTSGGQVTPDWKSLCSKEKAVLNSQKTQQALSRASVCLLWATVEIWQCHMADSVK